MIFIVSKTRRRRDIKILLLLSALMHKNLVCNDHRRTQKLQFFYVRTELPFLSKFGPKIRIVSLRRNLVGRLIRICKFSGDAQFFRFRPEIPFFGKFGPKNQTYQFKIGTKTNLNMQNSMVMFFFLL